MQKLAKREEQIMQICWRLGSAFIKDIITEFPDPKPHYNTIATIVKILEDKKLLTHEIIGNMYLYKPLALKEDYKKKAVKDILNTYFDSSYSRMLVYFAKEQEISEKELNEIIEIIKSNKS